MEVSSESGAVYSLGISEVIFILGGAAQALVASAVARAVVIRCFVFMFLLFLL